MSTKANICVGVGGTTYSLPVTVNGTTFGYPVAVAGTTATAKLGAVKPNSTHFTVDANGFLTPKTATTSALGVCKFSSTYFTVSSGSVTPKAATESAKGVVELATAAETAAGTDATRAVTPAGLAAALAAAGGVSLEMNAAADLNNAKTTGFYCIEDLSSCTNAPLSSCCTQALLKVWRFPGTEEENGTHNWTVQELVVIMPGSSYGPVCYIRVFDDNPYTSVQGWRIIPNDAI